MDVHYQGYLDEHEDRDPNSVKALLIMNHQKNKPLAEREPVKDTQIKLAERNGSLIVETCVLLGKLEKYRNGEMTRDEILKELVERTGILK